ncbi:hypothetical protein DYB32_008097 [Aphanomyces invadans]|uniref:Uncharacterized protein n=1 Tax=Aphanomyces invadans TaxID=157072 RepID=A0A3R6VH76_9STRA|nr:hypothetical protein DYB32_008097 [Aphanomyces invadans]
MYQHHLDQLAETKKAKAELEALLSQARTVRHRVRLQQEDVHARKAQLMDRIAHVKHMTQECVLHEVVLPQDGDAWGFFMRRYITLQRRQAVEHDALRGPILHLLDVLKADKHFLHTNGFLNTAQDMPLPHILGTCSIGKCGKSVVGGVAACRAASRKLHECCLVDGT